MGMAANFHSVKRNKSAAADPIASIDITIGLLHSKYVPPPEMGMSRSIMAEELVSTP